MKYKEYQPHRSLMEHVSCFWTLEHAYTPDHPAEDVTPDAFIELILNFGSPYRLHDREMPRAILMGLLKKPLRFHCDGTVNLVATRFFAWGALPLLAPQADQRGSLATTLGREWDELASRIEPAVRADDHAAAVSILENHLAEKLLTATVPADTIRTAAQMLLARHGQVRITELAEHCGLSTRQLQRQFQDAGLSPKALARAIRFEAIRKRLMFDPDQSLTALAHEFDYTDQAHFIKDFRDFADRAPGEFAREMRTIRDLFWEEGNVVFLQVPDPAGR
jgi:AraC-like DNA-binding protein